MEPTSNIRIGPADWSYKDWEGIFYPPGMDRRRMHPVEYLARFFDTTEITTSFYGPLRPELAKLWCRRVAGVNPRFLFTAKLYRAFTHSPSAVMEPTSAATIRPTDEDEIRTREGLDVIAEEGRLGALLIQFPLSFKNTPLNREYVERLLRQFIEYPRVVEVRDSSWNHPDTLAAFARLNVSFCNIDPPVASTQPVSTAYIRLHGWNHDRWLDSDSRNDRDKYLYKASELEDWKRDIEKVAAKAQRTFIIAGNHFEARAGVNALELKAMFSNQRVMAPPTLIARYPEMRRFADPADDWDTATPGPQTRLA